VHFDEAVSFRGLICGSRPRPGFEVGITGAWWLRIGLLVFGTQCKVDVEGKKVLSSTELRSRNYRDVTADRRLRR
jgi:hypothetical protein